MKDKAFSIGLAFMSLSFLVCVISFWWLYYGIPVYCLGALLLLFSQKPLRTRLLLTFIPILAYVPTTYLFLLAYNYSPPKTFLIPADYNGSLRILYEEPCGITPERENGQQILTFPENGILILKTDFDRSLNINYFLVDAKGGRRKINGSLDLKARFSNRPFVTFMSSGTRTEITSNADPGQNPKGIVFSDFYVFNTDTTFQNGNGVNPRLDSLTDAALQTCRQK